MKEMHPTRATFVAMIIGAMLAVPGVYLVVRGGLPLSADPVGWGLVISGTIIGLWARGRYRHNLRARLTNKEEA